MESDQAKLGRAKALLDSGAVSGARTLLKDSIDKMNKTSKILDEIKSTTEEPELTKQLPAAAKMASMAKKHCEAGANTVFQVIDTVIGILATSGSEAISLSVRAKFIGEYTELMRDLLVKVNPSDPIALEGNEEFLFKVVDGLAVYSSFQGRLAILCMGCNTLIARGLKDKSKCPVWLDNRERAFMNIEEAFGSHRMPTQERLDLIRSLSQKLEKRAGKQAASRLPWVLLKGSHHAIGLDPNSASGPRAKNPEHGCFKKRSLIGMVQFRSLILHEVNFIPNYTGQSSNHLGGNLGGRQRRIRFDGQESQHESAEGGSDQDHDDEADISDAGSNKTFHSDSDSPSEHTYQISLDGRRGKLILTSRDGKTRIIKIKGDHLSIRFEEDSEPRQ